VRVDQRLDGLPLGYAGRDAPYRRHARRRHARDGVKDIARPDAVCGVSERSVPDVSMFRGAATQGQCSFSSFKQVPRWHTSNTDQRPTCKSMALTI
jgi:hypothetical protein